MQKLSSQLGKGAASQAGDMRDETPSSCAFFLAIQYRKRDIIKISIVFIILLSLKLFYSFVLASDPPFCW